MAKVDIYFNNKNYSIDKSTLSAATTALKSHLSTTMSGSGATIVLDGVSYNVDSAKLNTAKNNLVSYLGTIAGNGSKVVIGGVEYNIDSSKLQKAITDLESSFGGSVPSVSLITFYVNGTPYQAEEGMDWYSFINSEYNVDNHFENLYFGNLVGYNNIGVLVNVDVYHIIIPNGVYSAE
jgi:aminopeptidase N